MDSNFFDENMSQTLVVLLCAINFVLMVATILRTSWLNSEKKSEDKTSDRDAKASNVAGNPLAVADTFKPLPTTSTPGNPFLTGRSNEMAPPFNPF